MWKPSVSRKHLCALHGEKAWCCFFAVRKANHNPKNFLGIPFERDRECGLWSIISLSLPLSLPRSQLQIVWIVNFSKVCCCLRTYTLETTDKNIYILHANKHQKKLLKSESVLQHTYTTRPPPPNTHTHETETINLFYSIPLNVQTCGMRVPCHFATSAEPSAYTNSRYLLVRNKRNMWQCW